MLSRRPLPLNPERASSRSPTVLKLPVVVEAVASAVMVMASAVAVAVAVVSAVMVMASVVAVAVAVAAVMVKAVVAVAVMARAAVEAVVSAVVEAVVSAVVVARAAVAVVALGLKERMVRSKEPPLEAGLVVTARKKEMAPNIKVWIKETALAVDAVVTARRVKAKVVGVARSLRPKQLLRRKRRAPLKKRPKRPLSPSLKKKRKKSASLSMITSRRSQPRPLACSRRRR